MVRGRGPVGPPTRHGGLDGLRQCVRAHGRPRTHVRGHAGPAPARGHGARGCRGTRRGAAGGGGGPARGRGCRRHLHRRHHPRRALRPAPRPARRGGVLVARRDAGRHRGRGAVHGRLPDDHAACPAFHAVAHLSGDARAHRARPSALAGARRRLPAGGAADGRVRGAVQLRGVPPARPAVLLDADGGRPRLPRLSRGHVVVAARGSAGRAGGPAARPGRRDGGHGGGRRPHVGPASGGAGARPRARDGRVLRRPRRGLRMVRDGRPHGPRPVDLPVQLRVLRRLEPLRLAGRRVPRVPRVAGDGADGPGPGADRPGERRRRAARTRDGPGARSRGRRGGGCQRADPRVTSRGPRHPCRWRTGPGRARRRGPPGPAARATRSSAGRSRSRCPPRRRPPA